MPRHEKHPPFRWVSICGIFCCKTGDLLRFLTQAYPPGGVRAICIYVYLYIYMCIYMCICTYMYIYIYRCGLREQEMKANERDREAEKTQRQEITTHPKTRSSERTEDPQPVHYKTLPCIIYPKHLSDNESGLNTRDPSLTTAEILGVDVFSRKRAEYCFESTVSEKRTHWASLSFGGANSVSSAKKLGEFAFSHK